VIQRTILIALFMLMAFTSSSASALLVSTQPAWNGWMRADSPTEITIRVVGDRGGLLTLKLSDRNNSYTHRTNLEPNAEFVWRVSLSPPSGEPLQLRAQLDEEPATEQEITLRRHLTSSPLVAILADQPIPLDGIQATTIHVASDSLPFHQSSFAAMDLILIHRDSLKGLARHQLIALRQHAAQCGRIVIVGFTSAAMDRFAELAGCGGRFFVATQTLAGLDTRVANLLKAQVPQLPSPGSLRALLDNNGIARQIPPLVAFFSIYLCVLLIALRSHRAPVYFVSASITATLIGLVAWSMSPEHIDQVTWAEMENGTDVARTASILRILGDGDWVTLEIPDNTGPLQALQPVNLKIESVHNESGAASMSFDTRLFSQYEFLTSGVTAMPAPLLVENLDDVPRVTNTGTGKSPPALLIWNGLKYPVPPLAPNASWRPSLEPEPWGASRAEQLFRQRAIRDTTALLLEYPSSSLKVTDDSTTYLMVRL
jgi:hypothetical protein